MCRTSLRASARRGLRLSARRPTLPGLTNTSGALGVSAAILLDRDGRVLEVLPAKPALVGTIIIGRYPHLRAAVAGRAAVSNVVSSAVRGDPVVAFAAPFETRWGGRVFSGAFSVAKTPVGAYMSRVIVIPGRRVYLVDAIGSLIASSRPLINGHRSLGQIDPLLAASTRARPTGVYRAPGGDRTFVSSAVAGGHSSHHRGPHRARAAPAAKRRLAYR